jgi:hypothetical protein
MRVCVKYNVRENASGYYSVSVYVNDKLIREYEAFNVRINNRMLPPTKDICVNANVVSYDSTLKWLEISDVEV